MTKPLGYYVATNSTPLLQEMESAWGSTFDALNNCQRLWMVQLMADHLYNSPDIYEDHELDDEVFELTERVDAELSTSQRIALIEALIAQVKGV